MDKKAKKKLDVIHQKLHKLRQQLSGARKQPDDLAEIDRLEKEIAASEAEARRWSEA